VNGFHSDFGDFREVKHLLIIFNLYRFEFHTKTLIFTVFEISNFVLIKQHLREILIFCFNWKKSDGLKSIECLSKFMVTLLQLINQGMVSMFQGWRFENKPRSGQPKKLENKELEALLEED